MHNASESPQKGRSTYVCACVCVGSVLSGVSVVSEQSYSSRWICPRLRSDVTVLVIHGWFSEDRMCAGWTDSITKRRRRWRSMKLCQI